MKNFIRVCAGLAAVFLVPGILCMVMGTALGGSWSEAMRYTSVGNGRYGVQLLGSVSYTHLTLPTKRIV